MTIRASVVITGVATDYVNTRYNVSYDVAATNSSSTDYHGNGISHVDFSLTNKKANKQIATDAAAKILADTGFTIDPDDIYFPAICG